MIETALHYAAKGWKVFPLLPNGKRPATDNGFKAGTTLPVIITDWWTRWPDANVGIVTGADSGIVVLDVDRKHGVDGVVAAIELDLPETLVVRTPSGGFHQFFTLPDGVKVPRRIGVKPGLDILGDGGYVVAAGSTIDGACYEIVRNRPMVPCPDVLVKLAAHHKAAPVAPVAGKVAAGGRNQYLATLAGKLRQIGSDETEIVAALLAVNEQRNDPPLPEAEVRRTAKSIARYESGASERRGNTGLPRTIGPLIWLSDVQPVLAQAYIVRDLIAAGAAVVIYGDSNSGKTFFTLDLCLHIAAGRPWRDQRIQPGLVVYVAAEGGHGIRNRLAAYRQAAPWTKAAPFAVLPQSVDLLNPHEDTGPLIDVIRAAEETAGQKVAAIVLDTLARVMTGGNENDSRDMSGFIANVDRLRAETGAAVLIVHHAGKDASKGARGHSSLRAAVDTEILVEGLEGTRTATVCKQRDMPSGQVYAFTLEPVTVGTDAEDGTPITSCVVAVTDAPAKQRRVSGKNQEALLAGLREWQRAHNGADLISSIDLAAVANVQGLKARNRKQEAVDGLIRHDYLLSAVGGYRLAL